MKILIADDDPVSRRLLEATLVRFGHEVTPVADGQQAVEALLLAGAPRLAILDWMMPNGDGLTVCRTVRERSVTYVYVILLTTRDRREDMVAALDAEADDFLTKPFDVVELGARIRSGERVLGLQEQLIAAHEALRHEATHDRLTGLWNRGRILDQLGRELIRSRREHRPLSVVIADIDHFKKINDTHGHQTGDDVLRQVAERMGARSAERECVGRYGGEEFLIVLPGCDAQRAGAEAERLRAAVAASAMRVGTTAIPITMSFGLASTDRADEPPSALIQAADEALYRAKAAGRNRVETDAPAPLTGRIVRNHTVLHRPRPRPRPAKDSRPARPLTGRVSRRCRGRGCSVDDATLVRRMRAGDERAFSEFFDAYVHRLFRFAVRRVGSDDAAEDVVQATLIVAVRKIHTWRGEAALFTWLCTLCRHEVAAFWERSGRQPVLRPLDDDPEVRSRLEALASDLDSPARALERRETSERVQIILDMLPGRYGDILEWKYIQGRSVAEIASALSLTQKAVESLLTRARAAFREGFDAFEPS